MLGAISCGKKYIGQDISEIHVRESNQLISFLLKYGVKLDATVTAKNIFDSTGEYDCLLTCPPYGDKEVWLDVPTSKCDCDAWIDECIDRFKCKRYIFIVDDTDVYWDNVVCSIDNKSHLNTNQEFLIILEGSN